MNADLMEAMRLEGVSGEQIEAITRRLEAKKKAIRRSRNQRYRETFETHETSQDALDAKDVLTVSDETFETHETSQPRARDIENTYLDSKKERKIRLPKKFKHDLPEGWEPDEGDFAYGKKLGLLNGHFGGQLEAMRLWAKANKIMKADWHATLKGFLRSHAEKVGVKAPSDNVSLSNSQFFVLRDSEAGRAWWDHRFRETGKFPPADKNGGWYFPSEFPPKMAAE